MDVYSEATRYVSARILYCGDRFEAWRFETPIRSDILNRDPPERSGAGDKQQKNLFRAQQRIRQLIWSNLTDYTKVLTLTFAESELDMKVMRRKIQTFIQAMSRSGYKLRYIWVPEHQSLRGIKEGNEGSLHAHFVIFNEEKIPYEVINKCWKWGSTDIHVAYGCKTDDKERIRSLAAYLSKYISKEGVAEYGQRCYNCSLGLKQPEVLDLECFKFYDESSGRYKFVAGEQNFEEVIKNLNVKYSSVYSYNYCVNGRDVYNAVSYFQGDLKK